MSHTWTNYAINLARMAIAATPMRPLVVSYCVTTYCNLNCVYCEDFGARRNVNQPAPLPLDDARRLLAVIRQGTSSLIVTGGEPLLYPDLPALLAHARRDLRFHHITLLTNAALLRERMDVLPLLDRLMVSVDATTPALWDQTIRAEPGTAQTILDNVIAAAQRQKADGFRMVLNCVVTPETLAQVPAVLELCIQHGMLFSFSPQSANNWPRYELLVSQEYRDFVMAMIAHKRHDAPILGSMAYLRMLWGFDPYACYPMLAPRVMPDGGLAYPCRPIEREGDAHGGRDVNLLAIGDWNKAVQRATDVYGAPPSTCGSCFQQCYIEPSLMQARPWALLSELLIYKASRQGGIATYAPG
ncbi:MAG TPA: radical SAM protein [Anaerolineae bacterium]|nr:radical SAM protein [Anaerolineae bacterium]HQI87000.1 radical SAM protein [Anaerolineae bacterium]